MASSSQHTTIVRPQSIFTNSSFSLPTAYYEQTTPYIPDKNLKGYDEDSDEIEKNFGEDNPEGYNFDPIDDDYDLSDFVEAFNPNVQVFLIL